MNKDLLLAIRNTLQLVGGLLIGLGVFSEEEVAGLSEAILASVGGIISLVALVMSIRNSRKK